MWDICNRIQKGLEALLLRQFNFLLFNFINLMLCFYGPRNTDNVVMAGQMSVENIVALHEIWMAAATANAIKSITAIVLNMNTGEAH